MHDLSQPDNHPTAFGDARELAIRARKHEQELVDLVETLESMVLSAVTPPAGPAQHPGGAWRMSETRFSLVSVFRRLCIAARELRLLAEAVHRRLVEGSGPSPARTLAPARVLVVDDSEDLRDLMSFALTAAGLDVVTATNGLEAIVAAHNLRPAVVLMDINMPVLDGIESTRLLKSAAATRNIPVIAHTARGGYGDRLTPGLFTEVLAKPISPEAILEAVDRLIRQ